MLAGWLVRVISEKEMQQAVRRRAAAATKLLIACNYNISIIHMLDGCIIQIDQWSIAALQIEIPYDRASLARDLCGRARDLQF